MVALSLPGSEQSRVITGILLSCLAFGLFATADASAKYLSRDYAVLQILFLGSVFAFVPTLIFIWKTDGLSAIRPRRISHCFVRGGLTSLSVLAIVWSFTKLPLAEGYALAFTAPLIVAVFSGWLLQESVTWRQWGAIFVGFVGVLIILRPGFSILNAGHAAALGSAVLFALSLIVLRRIGTTETPSALLMTYLIATLAIYGPFLASVWVTPSGWPAWLLMVGIGIISGCGQVALVLAFRAAPAAIVAPFQYTQLIWGVFFGVVLFGDYPDLVMATGAVIVIGSGWIMLPRTESSRAG